MNIGVSRLEARKFVATSVETDQNGEDYKFVTITAAGWTFIDANESMFAAHDARRNRSPEPEDFEDDIPFGV